MHELRDYDRQIAANKKLNRIIPRRSKSTNCNPYEMKIPEYEKKSFTEFFESLNTSDAKSKKNAYTKIFESKYLRGIKKEEDKISQQYLDTKIFLKKQEELKLRRELVSIKRNFEDSLFNKKWKKNDAQVLEAMLKLEKFTNEQINPKSTLLEVFKKKRKLSRARTVSIKRFQTPSYDDNSLQVLDSLRQSLESIQKSIPNNSKEQTRKIFNRGGKFRVTSRERKQSKVSMLSDEPEIDKMNDIPLTSLQNILKRGFDESRTRKRHLSKVVHSGIKQSSEILKMYYFLDLKRRFYPGMNNTTEKSHNMNHLQYSTLKKKLYRVKVNPVDILTKGIEDDQLIPKQRTRLMQEALIHRIKNKLLNEDLEEQKGKFIHSRLVQHES